MKFPYWHPILCSVEIIDVPERHALVIDGIVKVGDYVNTVSGLLRVEDDAHLYVLFGNDISDRRVEGRLVFRKY